MRGLANQLRAALYLLSRDAYTKGALVIPALLTAGGVLVTLLTRLWVPAGTSADMVVVVTGAAPSLPVLDAGVVFGTGFAMMGLVSHELAADGRRASLLGARGRAGYVASRVIASGLLAVVLGVWSLLLTLVSAALTGQGTGALSPSELAGAFVTRVLVGWAYAVLCALLAQPGRSVGMTMLVVWLVTGGVLGYLLLMAIAIVGVLTQLFVIFGLATSLGPYLLHAALGSATFEVGPCVALPLAYLALFAAAWYCRLRRADA
ncbi:hypothetical protein [Olsenella profusa]|uniref:ABC transporter permease n=1 Tax=Olsenella profusa TaxID=138595 RepID=A0ABS2F008_9ACTN|nr:hypothetical protein [Olsenella profusa]MBM6774290.1 hypothetical protein [Olsenella profusa]